jgi:hypothetical protein
MITPLEKEMQVLALEVKPQFSLVGEKIAEVCKYM